MHERGFVADNGESDVFGLDKIFEFTEAVCNLRALDPVGRRYEAIAWPDKDFFGMRRSFDFKIQRMFAPARSQQQDVHARSLLP